MCHPRGPALRQRRPPPRAFLWAPRGIPPLHQGAPRHWYIARLAQCRWTPPWTSSKARWARGSFLAEGTPIGRHGLVMNRFSIHYQLNLSYLLWSGHWLPPALLATLAPALSLDSPLGPVGLPSNSRLPPSSELRLGSGPQRGVSDGCSLVNGSGTLFACAPRLSLHSN